MINFFSIIGGGNRTIVDETTKFFKATPKTFSDRDQE
jgi:hypothetical protein